MLDTGERQISPTIDGIRADHVNRYRFAANQLPMNSRIIDYACGVGYGAYILADAGHLVSAFERDFDAIAYAYQNYSHPGIVYHCDNANIPRKMAEHDAAICFETIEHLEDPRPLLKELHAAAPMLIASVPNEEVMPYEFAPGQVYKFHYRHYTKYEFNALLQKCGWCVTEWYGQEGPESDVEVNINGRTLIAIARRDELPKTENKQERHIAILGLGPSLDQYLEITKRLGGRNRFCDETWAINALGNVLDCDLIFHMDDVRIQEIRAAAAPASNIAAMLAWLKTSRVPVVTSRAHPDYPALVEFPLEDVLNNLGHDYFNNTAPYAIAFAIHTGATKISLFGMDYTYPNCHDAEKGRACVEFWLGQAHARGIEIKLPKTTTLLDSMYPRASRLYGYDTLDIDFHIQEDGYLQLKFTPKDVLPTAEQIEKNYDHSKPIHEQHLGN